MPFLFGLLSNVKLMASIAAIIAAFGAGVYIRGQWDESRLESRLKEQETALVAQCNRDKAVTERIGNDLVKQNSDLSRRVAEYRRLHKTRPVLISNAASSGDGSARGGPVGSHAVDSESLLEYAELAEGYRIRLVSCQNFIRLERAR